MQILFVTIVSSYKITQILLKNLINMKISKEYHWKRRTTKLEFPTLVRWIFLDYRKAFQFRCAAYKTKMSVIVWISTLTCPDRDWSYRSPTSSVRWLCWAWSPCTLHPASPGNNPPRSCSRISPKMPPTRSAPFYSSSSQDTNPLT